MHVLDASRSRGRRREADQSRSSREVRRRESRAAEATGRVVREAARRSNSLRTPRRRRSASRPIGADGRRAAPVVHRRPRSLSSAAAARQAHGDDASAVKTIDLRELRKYIDWSPFFLTWEMKGKYPKIFNDPNHGKPKRSSCSTTRTSCSTGSSTSNLLEARGVYGFWPAAGGRRRHHHLRRQHPQRRADPLPRPAPAMAAQGAGDVLLAGRLHRARSACRWTGAADRRFRRRVRRHRPASAATNSAKQVRRRPSTTTTRS